MRACAQDPGGSRGRASWGKQINSNSPQGARCRQSTLSAFVVQTLNLEQAPIRVFSISL